MKETSLEVITDRIFLIRGRRVMFDKDLAELYGVSTKALNQAVKRNKARFPEDFMFRLRKEEFRQVVTDCDHLKYSGPVIGKRPRHEARETIEF